MNDFGLEFYPSSQEDVYYRHPHITNRYISLNSYFNQIKSEKVAELEGIADALGAKYLKITLHAQKKTFTGVKGNASVGTPKGKGKGKKAKAEAEASIEAGFDSTTYEEIGIASESKYKPHAPVVPQMFYFSNDPDIKSLIQTRLGNNSLLEKTYKIKYSDSSKINAAVAVKIDAALKKMKLIDANATISNQVEEENRWEYEYHIEFARARKKRVKEDK